MNSIVKADIKVDSEEFFDTSDDQANYDGKRQIFIGSSTALMIYRFYYCFYNLCYDYGGKGLGRVLALT